VVIPEHLLREMIDQARQESPNECCGLLASADGVVVARYPITNADASPVHYTMEPREQLRAVLDIDDRGWDLGAIYHSHTHSRAYPSATDIGLAFYPDTTYIIISLADDERPDVRGFSIADGNVSEKSLQIRADS
jgi:proteasome lid subunit RPN8/RPN11